MEYPSKLIEAAVEEISKLPGIGKKTALRMALHLLKQEQGYTDSLTEALHNLRTNTKNCKICHIISDSEECTCEGMHHDPTLVCVVEDTPDVIAIQNTSQYHGYFHVLGGLISPLQGIGPGELNIESLVERIKIEHSQIKEVILALSPTMEGDTTAFYIAKRLKEFKVKITTLARGLPVGGELEYTDEVTLGRSIAKRLSYNLEED